MGVETRGQVFDVERLLVASVPGRNRWVPPSTVEQVRAAVAHVPPAPAVGGCCSNGRENAAGSCSTHPRSWTRSPGGASRSSTPGG